MKDRPVIVSKIVDECPGVKTFRLEFTQNAEFDFRPGQFVLVGFPESPKDKRAYSIASSPLEKGHIEITLNKVAAFSTHLFDLQGGEILTISGPHGTWFYRDEFKHAVLISGGIGITPFRSMIRYILDKGLPNQLSLVYCARTPTDILYRRELEEYARQGVDIRITITRPHLMAPDEIWNGPTGRIDDKNLESLVSFSSQARCFLCGPNQFVDSMKKILSAKGLARDHIFYEKWGEFQLA